VELCLFDATGQTETQRLPMPAAVDGVWQALLPGASAGLVYGWRVHGPWDPAQGQRFNPHKLLLDPSASSVLGEYEGQDIHLGHRADAPWEQDTRDNAQQAMKAIVAEPFEPAARGPVLDPAQRLICELHVKGFSALHPDIPPELRGTYAGLAHPVAIAHLKRMGVTTVSLMPLASCADELRLLKLQLRNYWGYNPVAWSAPTARFWSGQPGSSPRSELRAMVSALHAAGLEVLLDVVYNHSAETDEHGPTLSLRGIDNATYYHLDPEDPARYRNWTGCGNCMRLDHPLVIRMVLQSLRSWVLDFGMDGFRFDLAPALGRGPAAQGYAFSAHAPLLQALADDPLLSTCTLVAEPWDIGEGGYQLGQFPAAWLEWNDRFRDTQRGFWLHRQVGLGEWAMRLAGSSDTFETRTRAAHSSVNFVAAHDGFTVADLLRYTDRRNQANGEDNRDGHGHNLSINCGVEGDTSDPHIRGQRRQWQRVLLAITLLSLGTPMVQAGDSIGHSQGGNNNAYCQDNAISWLDWEGADAGYADFIASLQALRRSRAVLRSGSWWQAQGADQGVVARWFLADASTPRPEDWNDPARQTLAVQLDWAHAMGSAHQNNALYASCLLLCNGASDPMPCVLPPGVWFLLIDTAGGASPNRRLETVEVLPPGSLWLASAAPTATQ
jgi:glycogen operon protein